MKTPSQELLQNLTDRTKAIIIKVNKDFKVLSSELYNWKPDQEKWSILECLEHLNIFGNFYLKEIERTINNAESSSQNDEFKSGIFGNWVAESMLIKNGKIKPMKTAKSKNPSFSQLPDNVIERFLDQQDIILKLIEKSKSLNLTRLKVSTDITKWIKMRLGDILRFIVYHNERHVLQAEKVLNEINNIVSNKKVK